MNRLPHARLLGRWRAGTGQRGGGTSTSPAAHRQGGRRPTAWRVATPVVGLLSGTLFVVSAHSSEGTDLRPGRYTDLASFVRVDAAQYDALKQRVADLNAQISLLNSASDNKQVRRVNRKAARMKKLAGLEPVVGQGVTVTLSDAPQTTSADTPDNLNLLLVHQQDIQAVVNALWKGGADAVTIQGQRVVSTTGIRCIGNSVQLQGVPYSQGPVPPGLSRGRGRPEHQCRVGRARRVPPGGAGVRRAARALLRQGPAPQRLERLTDLTDGRERDRWASPTPRWSGSSARWSAVRSGPRSAVTWAGWDPRRPRS
jgi:uncharacterized protein YlxW (UPF0749 family)